MYAEKEKQNVIIAFFFHAQRTLNTFLAPSPNLTYRYITRGAGEMCGLNIEMHCAWPTCAIHYDLVNNYSSFQEWSWESMYWPHGPVHFWLGGFLDCAETYHQMAELVGSTIANTFVDSAFDHRKALYWAGLWFCDGNVGESESPKEVMIIDSLFVRFFLLCVWRFLPCFFVPGGNTIFY